MKLLSHFFINFEVLSPAISVSIHDDEKEWFHVSVNMFYGTNMLEQFYVFISSSSSKKKEGGREDNTFQPFAEWSLE